MANNLTVSRAVRLALVAAAAYGSAAAAQETEIAQMNAWLAAKGM